MDVLQQVPEPRDNDSLHSKGSSKGKKANFERYFEKQYENLKSSNDYSPSRIDETLSKANSISGRRASIVKGSAGEAVYDKSITMDDLKIKENEVVPREEVSPKQERVTIPLSHMQQEIPKPKAPATLTEVLFEQRRQYEQLLGSANYKDDNERRQILNLLQGVDYQIEQAKNPSTGAQPSIVTPNEPMVPKI